MALTVNPLEKIDTLKTLWPVSVAKHLVFKFVWLEPSYLGVSVQGEVR